MRKKPIFCIKCGNAIPADITKCALCGHSYTAPWIRLWHEEKCCLTFVEDATLVNRTLFHTVFRTVLTETGVPVANFFPSDNSPLFTIVRQEQGWLIQGTVSSKNYVLLERERISEGTKAIVDGSRLDIFSINAGRSIASFRFKHGTEE